MDAKQLRKDFPLLCHKAIGNRHVAYLDSASTAHKPRKVLDAICDYYEHTNANTHEDVPDTLSNQATAALEGARQKIATFINAEPEEIVFTRNATEGINIVAFGWAMHQLQPGDEIILSEAEHDSNLVPWQVVAKKTGATLKYVRLDKNTWHLDLDHFESLITPKTRLVALVHISNVIGCVLDADRVSAAAKRVGARFFLDSCQSVPHRPINVRALGCDWLVASGHKMLGPAGSGFLWGSADVMKTEMQPFMVGGGTVSDVFLDGRDPVFKSPPSLYEAGTHNVGGAVGLAAAIDYLTHIGMDHVWAHEQQLVAHLHQQLHQKIPGITFYGPDPAACDPKLGHAPLVAFTVDGVASEDILYALDKAGIQVRCGDHRCVPLHHQVLGLEYTLRVSLYIYNDRDDVDHLVTELHRVVREKKPELAPAGAAEVLGQATK